MSKSQIKRLHEQQELEKVAQVEGEGEESVAPQRKGPANRFAFFDDEDEAGNQSDDAENSGGESSAAAEQRKIRNRAKKNKKKAAKNAERTETENQMLARLTMENQRIAREVGSTSNTPSVEELMKIDMKLFDMSAEIKRKLGKAFKEAINPGQQEEQRWPPGKRATGRIVKNKPRWFPDRDYGLSMIQEKEEKGIVWFLIKHNNSYEQRERMFWMAEKGMSVGIVHEILTDTPYHLNSLLMLANVNRMNEDFNQAADLIERGIFYVDQYAAATFEPFNWRHRMDYNDYTNRAFYLLLHRHMLNAAQKRCWETAWNTAKLVFKLDPVGDPLAIMSIIDTYALRAKQFQWIVDMYESAKDFKKLHLLPNWPYSVALAKFQLAKDDAERDAAEKMLCTALRRFPSVVATIMDMLQIQADSDVMNCKMFTPFVADNERESLKLLAKIYTKETEELWKMPENLLFLERETRKVALSTDSKELAECQEWRAKRFKMYHGTSPNVTRLGQLLDLVPGSSISDPCPPANGRMQYSKDAASHAAAMRDGTFLSEFVRSIMPDYAPDVPDAHYDRMENLRQEFANFMNQRITDVRDLFENVEGMVMNFLGNEEPTDPEAAAQRQRVLEALEEVIELPDFPAQRRLMIERGDLPGDPEQPEQPEQPEEPENQE